uniref:Uncharacterized protein n=1 Tax=Parascaris equorum TaxID=6256 RepID=A0A914R7X0_PAREQ
PSDQAKPRQADATVDKSKEPTSDTEKKKAVIARKKIPPRMQAPIDVLDSIFDKQTQLLSSKFKSEQEKAAERQKIEMAKRKLSGGTVGLGPMIDRRKSVGSSPLIQQPAVQQTQAPSPQFSVQPLKNHRTLLIDS